jgi:D-alanine-D-alanine ligase
VKRRKNKKILAAVVYDAFVPRRTATAESEAVAMQEDARYVCETLAAAGLEAVAAPIDGNVLAALNALKKINPAVIVNLCESFRNRSSCEAQVAGLFEMAGWPCTGNNSNALWLCEDKFRAKAVLQSCGLPTPKGWLVFGEKDIPAKADFPLIVKPNYEDGGIGIYADSVAYDYRALAKRVKRVICKYHQPALIEQFIKGREFNVALIEIPGSRRIKVLPLSEISFAGLPPDLPRVVGYEAKWIQKHPFYKGTTPVCPARNVPPETAKLLRALALETWRVMRLNGYARIDFRVSAGGRPYILDVNPNPDYSADAGLARSLAAAGISLPDFWRGQVVLAMESGKTNP